MNARHLIDRFGKAGLPLELLAKPLLRRGGSQDVFQLDIARPDKRVRTERFRLFAGAQTNRIEVEGVDRHRQQLVLMVHEPRHRFETFVSKWQWRQKQPPPNTVRADKRGFVVEQFTSESKRHFLAGMDEQHLFVAQLPRGTSTVQGAHQVLRPESVRVAERGAFEKTVRQGEWFFISLHPRELAEVELEVTKAPLRVHRQQGIAQAAKWVRVGRPHVAEEVLVLGDRVYVRGDVRHPDHATLTLRPWRRVIGNTEASTPMVGVNFVD